MNANELRIGNWFTGFDNKPFQFNIEHFYLLLETYDIDEIIKEPITLTEECRNGIGLGINGKFCLGVDDRFYYLTLTVRNEVLVYDQSGEEFTFIGIKKYVHEIQNLIFDLSGKELEIGKFYKEFDPKSVANINLDFSDYYKFTEREDRENHNKELLEKLQKGELSLEEYLKELQIKSSIKSHKKTNE